MSDTGNIVRDSLLRLGLGAEQAGLPFMVVGGNALIHYGVARFTRDIDFLIPESSSSAWRVFIEKAGYRCIHATDGFVQFEAKEVEDPPVDLMVVDETTWKKLLAAGRREPWSDECMTLLPSPLHLVAMKLQAYRSPSRRAREQDWNDVIEIVRRWFPDYGGDEDLKNVFHRYGGPDAWTRMERELTPPKP